MRRSDIREMIRIKAQRRFIRAMSNAIEGQPLTQTDRDLLDAILVALLRGDDVADLTGTKPPHNLRSGDGTHIALHYLCLTQLLKEKADVAWKAVGDAWGLQRRDVQNMVADNWAALAMLPQYYGAPGKLLQLCEQRAWTARLGRRRSRLEPTTQGELSSTPMPKNPAPRPQDPTWPTCDRRQRNRRTSESAWLRTENRRNSPGRRISDSRSST
jgi:hypothetical protein